MKLNVISTQDAAQLKKIGYPINDPIIESEMPSYGSVLNWMLLEKDILVSVHMQTAGFAYTISKLLWPNGKSQYISDSVVGCTIKSEDTYTHFDGAVEASIKRAIEILLEQK